GSPRPARSGRSDVTVGYYGTAGGAGHSPCDVSRRRADRPEGPGLPVGGIVSDAGDRLCGTLEWGRYRIAVRGSTSPREDVREGTMKYGYLIDMDGVIYRSNDVIPGADAFINRLVNENVPFRFLTNNSQRTRRDIV